MLKLTRKFAVVFTLAAVLGPVAFAGSSPIGTDPEPIAHKILVFLGLA